MATLDAQKNDLTKQHTMKFSEMRYYTEVVEVSRM